MEICSPEESDQAADAQTIQLLVLLFSWDSLKAEGYIK